MQTKTMSAMAGQPVVGAKETKLQSVNERFDIVNRGLCDAMVALREFANRIGADQVPEAGADNDKVAPPAAVGLVDQIVSSLDRASELVGDLKELNRRLENLA